MTAHALPQLIGFDNAGWISDLLAQVRIQYDVKSFVSEHLSRVLVRQYRDLIIESIELVGDGQWNIDGPAYPDSTMVGVNKLCISLDLLAVVVARSQSYRLRLTMKVDVVWDGERYERSYDVLVREQTYLGAAS